MFQRKETKSIKELELRIHPGFPTGVQAAEKLTAPGHQQSQHDRTVRGASQGQHPVYQTRRTETGIDMG